MITAHIRVRTLDDDLQPEVFCQDFNIQSVRDFVRAAKDDGGVWFGDDIFIPYAEITEFLFDDHSGDEPENAQEAAI